MPQVLEGTWEELSSHAEEFAGKRLRLTVLNEGEAHQEDNGEKTAAAPQSLADLLKDHIGVVHGKGLNLAERSEEAFGEIMDEKYQKQGFSE